MVNNRSQNLILIDFLRKEVVIVDLLGFGFYYIFIDLRLNTLFNICLKESFLSLDSIFNGFPVLQSLLSRENREVLVSEFKGGSLLICEDLLGLSKALLILYVKLLGLLPALW